MWLYFCQLNINKINYIVTCVWYFFVDKSCVVFIILGLKNKHCTREKDSGLALMMNPVSKKSKTYVIITYFSCKQCEKQEFEYMSFRVCWVCHFIEATFNGWIDALYDIWEKYFKTSLFLSRAPKELLIFLMIFY